MTLGPFSAFKMVYEQWSHKLQQAVACGTTGC